MPPFAKDDYVRTPYGTGRVQNVRCDGIVIVRPDEWKLACDIIPTFYMNASYVTKAEPKQPVVEAKQPTFDEKFAVAKEVKDEGNRLFKNKQFEEAKDKYAEAISALNVRMPHDISIVIIILWLKLNFVCRLSGILRQTSNGRTSLSRRCRATTTSLCAS